MHACAERQGISIRDASGAKNMVESIFRSVPLYHHMVCSHTTLHEDHSRRYQLIEQMAHLLVQLEGAKVVFFGGGSMYRYKISRRPPDMHNRKKRDQGALYQTWQAQSLY